MRFPSRIAISLILALVSCAQKKVSEEVRLPSISVETLISTLDQHFKKEKAYPASMSAVRDLFPGSDLSLLDGIGYKAEGNAYRIKIPNYGGVSGDCTYYSEKRWVCSDFLPNSEKFKNE